MKSPFVSSTRNTLQELTHDLPGPGPTVRQVSVQMLRNGSSFLKPNSSEPEGVSTSSDEGSLAKGCIKLQCNHGLTTRMLLRLTTLVNQVQQFSNGTVAWKLYCCKG